MATAPPLTDHTLGIGLYSPADAAFFARLKPSTVRRWVFGTSRDSSAITNQITSGVPTVSFVDFVQTLAIHDIREAYSVSLQRIRAAVAYAESHFGIQYPLARNHKTYVITKGSAAGNIAIKVKNHLIQVSGRNCDQILMQDVVEPYLAQISFGDDGLACEYTAWKSPNGIIRMNPHICFGQPIVAECGISAATLYEAFEIEGGIKEAARAYGVQPKHIRLAREYFDDLEKSRAAA